MSEKKTILERLEAVQNWLDELRQTEHKKKPSDRISSACYVISVGYLLSAAGYCLKSFMDDVQIDPMKAVQNTNDLERMVLIDFLLPQLEKCMEGEVSAEVLATNLHVFCKNRIMSGNLTDMNCTNPMVNIMSVYRYKAYAEIVKVIDRAVVEFNREAQEAVLKAAEDMGKKAKA